MGKKDIIQVSEISLFYKYRQKACDRPKVKNAQDAYEIFKSHWSDQISLVEEFNILLLDRSNRVMCFASLFKGGVESTVVDLKIVFAAALKARASSIILAYNHPSGNIKPSDNDISLTRKFKNAGDVLDINVLDHIILGEEDNYYSFADNGFL